ncbi:hypothetical protein DFA_05127 [Cavenderia fasciculata]|uniref:Ankyrin repeat-containing protein n=1 Tax=Cavenderia fasciculata TaxID=261658 RepID=F4PNE4_CACFS|nr:uncharacterized protein DFA_05127 [Cavenderia fasciculata]EGG22997.1 hypothetical protein DFA_05127 [Cavenderia fasciculata]|eukprot:XP_004360848.1 hypothetical protein DFA_05127 [Cavenderia fasciculata]
MSSTFTAIQQQQQQQQEPVVTNQHHHNSLVIKSVLKNRYLLRNITKHFYLYDHLDQKNNFDCFLSTLNNNNNNNNNNTDTPLSSTRQQQQSSFSSLSTSSSSSLICRDTQIFKYGDITDLNWVCQNRYFSLLIYKLEELHKSKSKRSGSQSAKSKEIVIKDESIALVCQYLSDLSMIQKIAGLLSFRMFTRDAYIAAASNENTLVFQFIEKSWIQYAQNLNIRRDTVSLALCGALERPNLETVRHIVSKHSLLLEGSLNNQYINAQLLHPDLDQYKSFLNHQEQEKDIEPESSTLKQYFKSKYTTFIQLMTIDSFKVLANNQLLDNIKERYQFHDILIQYSELLINHLYNHLIINNNNNNNQQQKIIMHSDITILHYIYFKNYDQQQLIDHPSQFNLDQIINYIHTGVTVELTETQEIVALLAEVISRIPGLYGYRYIKKDIEQFQVDLPEKMVILMLAAGSNHLIDLLLENTLVYPAKSTIGNRSETTLRQGVEQFIIGKAIQYAKPEQMEYLQQQRFSTFFTAIGPSSQPFSSLLSLACDHYNLGLVSVLLSKAGLEPIANFNLSNIVIKLIEYNVHLLVIFRLVERLYFATFVNNNNNCPPIATNIRSSLKHVVSYLQEKVNSETIMTRQSYQHYLTTLMHNIMAMACYFGRLEVVQFIHSIHPDPFTSTTTNTNGMVMNCLVRGGVYRVDEILEFFKQSNRYDPVTQPTYRLLGQIGKVDLLKSIIEHVKNPSSLILSATFEEAIIHGRIDIVRFIHESYPTHYVNNVALAITHGHLDIVQFMVEDGYKNDRLGIKLHKIEELAIKHSRMEIYEYAIQKGLQKKEINQKKDINQNNNQNQNKKNNNNNNNKKNNDKKKKNKNKK